MYSCIVSGNQIDAPSLPYMCTQAVRSAIAVTALSLGLSCNFTNADLIQVNPKPKQYTLIQV